LNSPSLVQTDNPPPPQILSLSLARTTSENEVVKNKTVKNKIFFSYQFLFKK